MSLPDGSEEIVTGVQLLEKIFRDSLIEKGEVTKWNLKPFYILSVQRNGVEDLVIEIPESPLLCKLKPGCDLPNSEGSCVSAEFSYSTK